MDRRPRPDRVPEGGASPKRPLLTLLGNPRLRERVRIAFRMGASSQVLGQATLVTDWRQLSALAARHPGSPVLIDAFHEGPRRPAGESAQMGADNRSALPVIWYAPLNQAYPRELRRAGITVETHLHPGVNDDFQAINAAILRSIDARRVHRLREHAKRVVDPAAFEVFDHAIHLATGPCTVPDLAVRVRWTRRTLELRCAKLGIPAPKRLISLARIFTVQRLAEWSNQPSGTVARALGFSDRSNYRRLVRKTLGCPPSRIRPMGGSDYVAEVFLRRLGG